MKAPLKEVCVIVLCLAIFSSCKKEPYPESEKGEPVFYFKGMIGNELIDLKGGVDNYYLFSDFFQTPEDSGLFIYSFTGALKPANCSNCINSIEIRINDYKTSTPGIGTNISEALKPGNFSYSEGSFLSTYNVKFSSSFTNGVASQYSWNFGDGSTSGSANPIHSFAGNGPFNVCLAVTGNDTMTNCYSSICNTIGSSGLDTPFIISLSTQSSGNWVEFIPEITGGQWPYNFYWEFGDSTTSEIDTGVTKKYSSPGMFETLLRVIDANGDTAYARVNAPTSTYTSCVTNFKVVDVEHVLINNIGLSNIIISWTDQNGTVFKSDNSLPQPVDSYFQIVSEEAYLINENNQLTRKIHLKFSCMLYNGAQSILVKDAEAVIAVAYE